MVFICSVSGLSKPTPHQSHPVPDIPLADSTTALSTSYAESKHFSERFFSAAHSRSGLRVAVLRVDQIAGPLAPRAGKGVVELGRVVPKLNPNEEKLEDNTRWTGGYGLDPRRMSWEVLLPS